MPEPRAWTCYFMGLAIVFLLLEARFDWAVTTMFLAAFLGVWWVRRVRILK